MGKLVRLNLLAPYWFLPRQTFQTFPSTSRRLVALPARKQAVGVTATFHLVVRWADVPGARWVGELAGKDRAWGDQQHLFDLDQPNRRGPYRPRRGGRVDVGSSHSCTRQGAAGRTRTKIAIEIAFHQCAKCSWARYSSAYAAAGRRGWSPGVIGSIAISRAVLTWRSSGSRRSFFPSAQPIFTLQQPYWIGLLVQASSALM